MSEQLQKGMIQLKLEADSEQVKINVIDNGKGMKAADVAKIQKNVSFTQGKRGGHGIGLSQIWEMLENNDGSMNIISEPRKGTHISLVFQRSPTPSWCMMQLDINPNDMVVIVDDDPSIHGAWNIRFQSIVQKAPEIKLHHFESTQEALQFIHTLDSSCKERLILLSDYEFLGQKRNGLDLIKQAKVNRSILVTSHYGNKDICARAIALQSKILPKQLANEIPLFLNDNNPPSAPTHSLKQVDAVIIDDDEQIRQMLQSFVFDTSDKVDFFQHPEALKAALSDYPKDTRILIDKNFAAPHRFPNGITFAKELHALGYTRLYLISGEQLHRDEVPDYITIINKMDLNTIKEKW